MALTSCSVWPTESARSATRFAALSCCRPSSARSARACPISSFPSKTSAWTAFCRFSSLSRLVVAARERPMASAASWCVSLNSPISRCTPPASSSGLRFSLWMFSTSAMASADESGTSRASAGISARPAIFAARQGDIRLRAFAFAVELHGGRAEARRLGEPYVARNHGFVHLLAEVLLQLRRHLLRERIARIVHGSKQPFDIELRIQVLADLFDRVHEIGEPLKRVVLTLHRYHHRIGCDQSIQGEQVERRRAVEQDEFVLAGDRFERAFQAGLAVLKVDQFYFRAGEVAVGG